MNQLKQTFHEQTGKSWDDERIRFHTIRSEEFAATYTAVRGGDLERAKNLLTEYRKTHNLSIESFAEKIKAYVQAQPEGFRLNFYVDEVGQFIANNTQRMLNLQTVVETLNTVCGGQAWIFVTSQASLEAVVGRDPGKILAVSRIVLESK